MIGRPLVRPSAAQDRLLRAAFHPDLDVARESARAWESEADLDTLDFTSVQMLPTLANRAGELSLSTELSAQITNVARVTWLRTESHARAIAPAVSDLRDAGCDPVLMKGAALVFGHGAPARLRPMFDVDVLVDPARVSDAARLLVARGFAARDAAGLIGGERRLLALKHGEEFARGDGISLDLHWSALRTMRRPEIASSLRANAVDADLAGAPCRSLGRTDLLIVTIAHAADPFRTLRERWVGDCVLLVRGSEAAIDWELVAARGRDWRMSRQIVEAFDYLADVAGVELPSPTRNALRRNPVPVAVRARRIRKQMPDGSPAVSRGAVRVLEEYEMEIGDLAPIGHRTGASDFLDFVARRRGLSRRRELPGDLVFAAAGRPWRTRRKLRAITGIGPAPTDPGLWPRYELGEEARFGGPDPRSDLLASGWWFPEDFGTWSRGGFSRLRLALAEPIDRPAVMTLGVRAPLAEAHPRVAIDVVVNQYRLTRVILDLATPAASHSVEIPAAALTASRGVEIDFVIDKTGVPAELGLAPDLREIGFGLGELAIAA